MFGLGNSLYSEHYSSVGKSVDLWLEQLGAKRFAPLGLGDENVVESLHGSQEADFDHWTEGILHLLVPGAHDHSETKKGGCAKGDNCCSKKKNKKRIGSIEDMSVVDHSDTDSDGEPVLDLEDLGGLVKTKKTTKDEDEESEDGEDVGEPNGELREMLTPQLRQSLTKQGYRLIGSHSGVKLCRWTKVTCVTFNKLW